MTPETIITVARIDADDARAEMWRDLFGDLCVPVKTEPIYEFVDADKSKPPVDCYTADLKALGRAGFCRLVNAMKKHGFTLPYFAALNDGLFIIPVERVVVVKAPARIWPRYCNPEGGAKAG